MNQVTRYKLNTCEAEYTKDPKIKKEDIAELMTWVQKQAHMPDVKECILIQFYHASDYSLHRAKNLLDLFYKYKNEVPELFVGGLFLPPQVQYSIWDVSYQFAISSTTDGMRYIYFGFRDTDPTKFSHEGSLALTVKLGFLTMMEKGTCSGISTVYDARGFGLRHLAVMNFSAARKFLYYAQEVMPMKVADVHIIYAHPVVNKFLQIVKPFIKKELSEKIHLHTDINEFYDAVGKENIPLDLGGDFPSTTDELNEMTKMKFEALSDVVDEELRQRADESKRIDNKSSGDALELNGSFRALQVD